LPHVVRFAIYRLLVYVTRSTFACYRVCSRLHVLWTPFFFFFFVTLFGSLALPFPHTVYQFLCRWLVVFVAHTRLVRSYAPPALPLRCIAVAGRLRLPHAQRRTHTALSLRTPRSPGLLHTRVTAHSDYNRYVCYTFVTPHCPHDLRAFVTARLPALHLRLRSHVAARVTILPVYPWCLLPRSSRSLHYAFAALLPCPLPPSALLPTHPVFSCSHLWFTTLLLLPHCLLIGLVIDAKILMCWVGWIVCHATVCSTFYAFVILRVAFVCDVCIALRIRLPVCYIFLRYTLRYRALLFAPLCPTFAVRSCGSLPILRYYTAFGTFTGSGLPVALPLLLTRLPA